MGHFVKPTSQNPAIPDRAPLPRQHEKCRLKHVLRIVMLVQHMTTNPQHHRSVAIDQSPERFLRLGFLAAQELVEQVLVRELLGSLASTLASRPVFSACESIVRFSAILSGFISVLLERGISAEAQTTRQTSRIARLSNARNFRRSQTGANPPHQANRGSHPCVHFLPRCPNW